MITLRSATAADAVGIAHVHVETWRTAYRGILPAELLAALSVERRAAGWRQAAAHSGQEGRSLTVAEDDGRIVGFAAGGPVQTPDPVFTGELYAIYVLDACQRRGIGRWLVRAVAEALAAGGHRAMLVWVLAANSAARRFYESLGGRHVRDREVSLGGAAYPEVGYGWDDLPALLQQISAGAGSPPGSAGTAG
ncbi:MAG TPA: GNAT family N-acetyltransferase [bacterium]|nr:GNAT family N-acetyltransferase [bacterium]